MAITECAPSEWTTIPDTGGQMLLEARGIGFYVWTGPAGSRPDNPAEGYALASNEAMVIEAGVVVGVQPAQPVKSVNAYSNLV